MNCVAIDDEKKALEVIELYVRKLDTVQLIGSFTDPIKASDFIEHHSVDLLFLDINMLGLNGFELLASLTYQPLVIFTTAYSEYAVKSYTIDALDYLLKPITFGRFLKAVRKAEARLRNNDLPENSQQMKPGEKPVIAIKSGNVIHRIPLDNILYLESEGNYTSFVTSKGKILSLCTMKKALSMLDETFLQVHRSYTVASGKVEKIESHQLTVAGKVIPIGGAFRKKVALWFKST